MKKLIQILLIFMTLKVTGQPPTNRYTSALFANYSETTNIKFSTNVQRPNPGGGVYETLTGYPLNVDEFSTTAVNLYMNIFQPTGDTLSKRPLIIICFGGGFVAGSKDYWSMRLLAQNLTKRGYVTALIDYRLGMNMFDADLANRAVYRGIQDGRSAVRFFRADAAGANTYRIDPNNIYIGGHSAGAFIATHNAYLDKEFERPASTYTWLQGCGFWDLSTCTCPNQGCLDCVGDNQSFSGHANAIFSLAGALGFTSFIESANDPKMVMFHSQDDDTVPYTSGEPFGSISYLVVGSDLPVVYGSLPMSQRAQAIGLPYQFYSYTNRGHSVHEETGSTLWSDIVPGISNWFFDKLLKPAPHVISGKTYVCASAPTETYSVQPGLAKYYQWQVTGGALTNLNPSLPTVTVIWDVNAPIKSISMTPYSALDAKGDIVTKNITVAPLFQNTWTSTSGNWSSPASWSMFMIPESCHNVVLPAQSIPVTITVPENTQQVIKGLNVGTNVTLKLSNPSQVTVEN